MNEPQPGARAASPMFPLGTVLVPGALLPLRLFEPRYRAFARDVVDADGTGSFGVCLIERGSEVGGGEVRTDIATRAEIVRADEHPDGQWSLLARGIQRLRVERWLPDEPYPRAMVADWPDPPPTDADPAAVERVRDVLDAIVDLVERRGQAVDAVRLELAHADPHTDPAAALWQFVASSPLGPADRQRLLAAPDITSRAALAAELLGQQHATLTALTDDPDG